MSRVKKFVSNDNEESLDVDLAPMLALMVCLIPIMLLSTVFVRVTIIETPLPQVVKQALEEDRQKKERDILVAVEMSQRSGFTLQVSENGKVVATTKLAKKGKDWDLAGLHKELVKVKQGYPKLFRLNLYPSEDVAYEDMVRVMDEARNTKEGDPKLFVIDSENDKKVETDVMFPDVMFGNVMEG